MGLSTIAPGSEYIIMTVYVFAIVTIVLSSPIAKHTVRFMKDARHPVHNYKIEISLMDMKNRFLLAEVLTIS